MTKAAYSFFDTDVTKYMAPFKVPAMDVDAVMSSYRRNIEALTAANQCALEGVGAVVRRQAEIARDSIESYSKAVGDLLADGSVDEKAARQAEIARQSYDRAVANAREIGDMITKTSTEAFGLLNDRVREGFGEVQGFVANGAAQAAASVDQATFATRETINRSAQAADEAVSNVERSLKAAAPKQ